MSLHAIILAILAKMVNTETTAHRIREREPNRPDKSNRIQAGSVPASPQPLQRKFAGGGSAPQKPEHGEEFRQRGFIQRAELESRRFLPRRALVLRGDSEQPVPRKQVRRADQHRAGSSQRVIEWMFLMVWPLFPQV